MDREADEDDREEPSAAKLQVGATSEYEHERREDGRRDVDKPERELVAVGGRTFLTPMDVGSAPATIGLLEGDDAAASRAEPSRAGHDKPKSLPSPLTLLRIRYCDALSELPEEAVLKNREATYQSMKNIFHHIVKVHDGWLNVSAQDDSPDPKVYDGDFDALPTMASVRAYMEKVIAKEQAFLASLKDDDLDRPIQAWWKKRPHPLRDALMQVTLEQAHHLGELIALFWQQDVEPPEMTWIDVRMEITGIPGPS